MPLPHPKKNESRTHFISRCYSNKVVRKEFKEDNNRIGGVCFSLWQNKKSKASFAVSVNGEEYLYTIIPSDSPDYNPLDLLDKDKSSDDIKAYPESKPSPTNRQDGAPNPDNSTADPNHLSPNQMEWFLAEIDKMPEDGTDADNWPLSFDKVEMEFNRPNKPISDSQKEFDKQDKEKSDPNNVDKRDKPYIM